MIEASPVEKRIKIVKSAVAAIFIILLGRFFQLQVLSGGFYKIRSDANYIRQNPIPASRGLIFDRSGRVIVDNEPGYSLFCVPYTIQRKPDVKKQLLRLTRMDSVEFDKRLSDARRRPFTPIRIMRELDFATLSYIEENLLELPGVFYQIEPIRRYMTKARMTHVLGYTGEASDADIRQNKALRSGDITGKTGLEAAFDDILRGERGYSYTEVNALGREMGQSERLKGIKPVSGKNIQLTIDLELQILAESLLKDKKGSVIMLDPAAGDVLVMASAPDFPLDAFAKALSPALWRKLLDDLDKPLVNRAIQAQLPPGSTYKLVTAAAMLSNEMLNPEEELYCSGSWNLGRRVFNCWDREGHGFVNILDALGQSCNVYFYQASQLLTIDVLAKTGEMFRFGKPTGIDIPGEAAGNLPTVNFMNNKYGVGGWGRGMLVNLAIGQGDVLVTPIQMALLSAITGMRGNVIQPGVLKNIYSDDNIALSPELKKEKTDGIDEKVYSILTGGMIKAVNDSKGTARGAAVPGIQVAGKTGTAQNPHGEAHAWFTGFAPAENPQVAIAVVIENGGSGGRVAAPIAGRLLKKFFTVKDQG